MHNKISQSSAQPAFWNTYFSLCKVSQPDNSHEGHGLVSPDARLPARCERVLIHEATPMPQTPGMLHKHVTRRGPHCIVNWKYRLIRPREAPEGWCPQIWVFEAQKSSNLCPEIWVFDWFEDTLGVSSSENLGIWRPIFVKLRQIRENGADYLFVASKSYMKL